ncbi:MAG: DUF2892 domain-containing protein [Rectinemataceae bacterium]|nr:DUF2892 domain-containing protein [Spirochaetaceae bacterium]
MTRNMGKTDRTIRITAAVVVILLILTGALSGAAAWILGILAVVFLLTSAVSFCPLYTVLGISTNASEKKEDRKS